MAMEWFRTDPAKIIEHTVHIRGIGDDVRQALTAVKGVSVPGEGFGTAGAEFAKILAGIADEGTHTLDAAITAMETSAGGLKKSAEDYENAEAAARERLRKAGQRP